MSAPPLVDGYRSDSIWDSKGEEQREVLGGGGVASAGLGRVSTLHAPHVQLLAFATLVREMTNLTRLSPSMRPSLSSSTITGRHFRKECKPLRPPDDTLKHGQDGPG